MESIFICGGGSAVPGVGPRLLQEISAHLLPSMQPVLCPLPEYMPEHASKVAASMGAAALSKAVFAQNHHINRTEYDEYGPSFIHRKCFS